MAIMKLMIGNGSVLAVKLKDGSYLDEDGNRSFFRGDVKGARNVPEEAKTAFAAMTRAYQKKEQWETKLRKIQHEYRLKCDACDMDIQNAAADARRALGRLSWAEFKHAFYQALPQRIQEEMHKKGYSASAPDGIVYTDSNLYISKNKVVAHYNYGHEPAYIQVEYDGTAYLADDAEDLPVYQDMMKRSSTPLSVQWSQIETLAPGEKGSIWYHSTYEIPLYQPLTESYAKELATSFAER